MAAYLDDVIVTGRTKEEHLHNLKQVLAALTEYGMKLRLDKCEFFQQHVTYLGHVISADGLKPSEERVDAIVKIPTPENVKQLESFIGKLNYYGKFLPSFSTICAPLNRLRRQDVEWDWSAECDQAFSQLKEMLAQKTRLVHYDPTKPITLAADASSYGIGAVISQCAPDGTEQPIAFASKTLTSTEKNYSQVEKEALSIIFGVRKFHQYLSGRHFQLTTDHKPLLAIFSPEKSLPVMTLQRLQRWALIMMGYDYHIVYRKSADHANADALSRLPIGPDPNFDKDESIVEIDNEVNMLDSHVVLNLPLSAKTVADYTRKDPILAKVLHFVTNGWPTTWPHNQDKNKVRTYLNAQTEITSKDGVLLRDSRVIIPTALRARVLNMLHLTHIGIVRMKSLARMHVWWPNIEVDIAAHCKDCTACAETGPNQPENLSAWPVPDGPWQRIHIDFAGPFLDDMWLVVMDAYSKWPHVLKLNKYPTSETTTSAHDDLFAMWGRPETIVSDNGPQFASKTFAEWCNAHSIAHLTSAPFHPASNGEAERLVGVFKQAMKRAVREEKKSKHLALREFLQQYRVTPHCTTGRTPAELMLGHQVRSSLSVLQTRAHKTKLQKKSTSPAKPKFTIGAHVHYRDYTRNRPKWVAGKVTGHVGNKMFTVQGPDGHCRRHEDQLKLRSVPKLNRQRRLSRPAPIDSARHTKTDQQRFDNCVPEFVVHQPDEAANEELPVLVHQPVLPVLPVLPRRSTRVNVGIPPIRLIAE